MENEPYTPTEGRSSRRDRIIGKLFGAKDRKVADQESAANLDAFLHSSSDNLNVTHAPPPPPGALPKLAKLDTTTISRFPQALAVNQQAQLNRPLAPGRPDSKSPAPSSRPNRKGLTVRFADSPPDVIGEGGDESELPVADISKRTTARPPQPPPHKKLVSSPDRPQLAPLDFGPPGVDDFRPKPLSRTQTGFSSIYTPESPKASPTKSSPVKASPTKSDDYISSPSPVVPGKSTSARFLGAAGRNNENRKSFIEVHQAEMREAEGRAFAQATRANSATSATTHDWEKNETPLVDPFADSPQATKPRPQSPETQFTLPNLQLQYSPASVHSNTSSLYSHPQESGKSSPPAPPAPPAPSVPQVEVSTQPPMQASQPSAQVSRQPSVQQKYSPQVSRQASSASQNGPFAFGPLAARSASVKLHDVVTAASNDALNTFVSRTKHLFELFRLHAETFKPLAACSLKECGRGALWWFLRGRMGLETAIRERPSSPKGQMQNEVDRQQAYSNLAKGWWLSEEVIPEISESQGLSPDPEVTEARQTLVSALRKLAMSMNRNGFLPPEDAFLPQTIDKSIWLEYPALSQDMIALLSGNWGSGMTAMQTPLSTLHILDAFPLGDNAENFNYGRVPTDVYLMEQGRENQRFFFPCMLSMIRPQRQTGLVFLVASQNGHVQLAIQENKNAGPIWDDIRWRNENSCLDIKLPRGFLLTVQLTQADYRMLWGMYDFGAKIQASLFPRKDEEVVFRNTLKSFHYIDSDPQSRLFPKEQVFQCDVALFERIFKEIGPAGPRVWHKGYRIAVVTGPKTRTLSGVTHSFPPSLPVQFGFFRGEGDTPTLSLKYEGGRQKARMVLTFNDDKERIRFHSLITGTALNHDEKIYSDVPIKSLMVSQSMREPVGMAPFNRMPWKAARVVNDECGGDPPPTVLADRLKIVLEYQNGNVTDRINVAPGELRMRLEVSNAKVLRLLRQPQHDISMSVSDSQVPKELPKNMSDALQLLRNNQTIRTFEFGNLKDLHSFQFAVTGFEVIFDALAVTFAISRRRMVVPIHKKWEAGYTRIQVVKQEDKQLQLLAFFEDFHHGHCMNFVLKGTDVYEGFQRGSGKAGIKFIDAKFPLPRLPADKDGDYDDMAFVCLDLPDLPGEHDDISIVFEKEEDRDRLSQCLPAPIKVTAKSSRLK